MLSCENLLVEIGPVDFEILDFLRFVKTVLRKNVFLAITQKVLGYHQKNVQILIPLVESFDLSYV